MTALVLRWRKLDPPIVTRWRGPDMKAQALAVAQWPRPLAAIIAPQGPQGPAGQPTRFDVSLAGTWIIPHGLGRVCSAQVFLQSGEAILTDLAVDAVHITVTFATPQQGFVLAN